MWPGVAADVVAREVHGFDFEFGIYLTSTEFWYANHRLSSLSEITLIGCGKVAYST